MIYLLHRQQASQQRASFEGRRTVMSFIARTSGEPLALSDEVRTLVGKVDPTTPVTAIRTVESYANAGQIALLDYVKTLLGVFALVAVAISAAGVYGLTVYGIAQRRTVPTLTIYAAGAVAMGVAVGLYGWLRLASVIASFLTNLTITPSDPRMLFVVSSVLVATALVVFVVPVLGTRRSSH